MAARAEVENKVVAMFTVKCGDNCSHCKHIVDICDVVAVDENFRSRYCGSCRYAMVYKFKKATVEEYVDKKINATDWEGQFMPTGKMYFTSPALYEYINVGTDEKLNFHSNDTKVAFVEFKEHKKREREIFDSIKNK